MDLYAQFFRKKRIRKIFFLCFCMISFSLFSRVERIFFSSFSVWRARFSSAWKFLTPKLSRRIFTVNYSHFFSAKKEFLEYWSLNYFMLHVGNDWVCRRDIRDLFRWTFSFSTKIFSCNKACKNSPFFVVNRNFCTWNFLRFFLFPE